MKYIPQLVFCSFLTASAVFFFQTQKENRERKDHFPEEKFEPYDHFMQVRSWPDRAFSASAFAEKGRLASQILNERTAPCGTETEWAQEGPGNIAGRCNVIKASPTDPNFLLAGFATGGIYKSTDGGANWKFTSGGADVMNGYAISDFAFSPTAPGTIYAAVGDANISAYPSTNSGILKSVNGGETWAALPFSPAINVVSSKIFAHPTNPGELWWASMGSPFNRDDIFRGIYKSSDGGQTWSEKLAVSNQAGAIDLVVNPTDPQIMFAVSWDRIRTNSESIIGGPGTKIWRTNDGGQTWTKLTNGLPNFTTSRPGLIMSPTNPNKIFAVFADSTAKFLGIWKTTNGGDSWAPINTVGLSSAFVDFGWYFSKIRLDPANDERIFCLGLNIYKRSLPDNGFSTDVIVHSDVHDLLFRPDGSRLVGCDGGIYHIPANAQTSTRIVNIPTTQFYHVGWNPHKPNNYYGGSQDNGTMHGSLPIFNTWPSVFGGDGFRSVFHPIDSKTYYFETQNGSISGTNNAGQTWKYGSAALGTTDRTNWDTPYLMSPHDPNTLFAGTFKIYKNQSGPALLWEAISPDLTDGNIFGPRFHTISTIDESKLEAGRLAAGTSDGNVWVKTAQGQWTNVTAGLPDRYVTQVRWSETVKDRIFVSLSGYRLGEKAAKFYRSDNLGATWESMVTFNSPVIDYLPINDFLILPNSADSAIIVATDFDVYVWKKDGAGQKLGKNRFNLPIFDLDFDPVNRKIIAGTWGRGIWTFPVDSIYFGNNYFRTATVSVKNPKLLPVSAVQIIDLGSAITDAAGQVSQFSIPCFDQKIQVSQKTGPLDGVSTFDLVAMSKHVLNVAPFTEPWQFIAADINKNKQVTTFDIVELRKLILGIYTDFPSNTSWRFHPKNFVFTKMNPAEEALPDTIRQYISPDADTTFFEFTGIKVGDVNGDWMPFAPEASDRRPLEIFTENHGFEAGEIFETEFSAGVAGLIAGQFTLGFDEKMLRIESVEPLLKGMTDDFFGKNRLGEGLLTGCFWLENPFGISEKICRVKFRAMKKGNLKTAIRMADWPTPSRGFSPEGIENQAVISFFENEKSEKGGANWRFSENPIGAGPVYLRSDLTEKKTENLLVQLAVFDAAGRFVFSEKRDVPADGRFLFSTQKLPETSGVFFVKIENGGHSQTLRLIKTNAR